MTEKFLIDQIILYYGTYERYGNKNDEQVAYRRLDQLRKLRKLKDAEEAVDYLIAVLEQESLPKLAS